MTRLRGRDYSPHMAARMTLRAARKRAGFTGEALAVRVGLHRMTISRLERGVVPYPRYDTVRKLEKVLGVALRFPRQPRADETRRTA